jgi:hypothetical protein
MMNKSHTIHQSRAGGCSHGAAPPCSESRDERLDTARRLQQHAHLPVAVVSAILFLSGMGALIFETLWLRLSGLAFGNSVWAAALILSSFMAGPGARERDRRMIENSTMAAASSLCLAGGARRPAWLHDRFWSSGAGRIVATSVANALELSAHASRPAVRRVFPNSTYADNGDGPDAAGVDRRSNVAANQFWTRDWFSVWLERFGCGGWCCAR